MSVSSRVPAWVEVAVDSGWSGTLTHEVSHAQTSTPRSGAWRCDQVAATKVWRRLCESRAVARA